MKNLGSETAQKRNVSCTSSSIHCGSYDPTLDPSAMNEFSVGIFRMFHINSPNDINLYDASKKYSNFQLFF